MLTINIHEAKTNLSRLIDMAVKGEPFIIAKAGKPLVKVTRIEKRAAPPKRRLGFMNGQIPALDDFDLMGEDEICSPPTP